MRVTPRVPVASNRCGWLTAEFHQPDSFTCIHRISVRRNRNRSRRERRGNRIHNRRPTTATVAVERLWWSTRSTHALDENVTRPSESTGDPAYLNEISQTASHFTCEVRLETGARVVVAAHWRTNIWTLAIQLPGIDCEDRVSSRRVTSRNPHLSIACRSPAPPQIVVGHAGGCEWIGRYTIWHVSLLTHRGSSEVKLKVTRASDWCRRCDIVRSCLGEGARGVKVKPANERNHANNNTQHLN